MFSSDNGIRHKVALHWILPYRLLSLRTITIIPQALYDDDVENLNRYTHSVNCGRTCRAKLCQESKTFCLMFVHARSEEEQIWDENKKNARKKRPPSPVQPSIAGIHSVQKCLDDCIHANLIYAVPQSFSILTSPIKYR